MFTQINVIWILVLIFITFLFKFDQVEGNIEEHTGKLARPGQFPFVARLYSKLKDLSFSYCTATALSSTKLLTAGHCCDAKADRFIVLGDPDQTDFDYKNVKKKYVVYKVKKAIIHPRFERTKIKLIHDLCILILDTPMKASDGFQNISISFEEIQNPKNCTALGWGSNYGYQLQHKLYYKQAIGYKCGLQFESSTGYWFVCLEPHSVCPGDSGGPLVCDGKVYGIASFFIGNGDNANPRCEDGVIDYYTDLNLEKNFILSSRGKGMINLSPLICAITLFLCLF